MRKNARPTWMAKPLQNEHIDEILVSINKFVTDGTVQKIYEYIKILEKRLDSEG